MAKACTAVGDYYKHHAYVTHRADGDVKGDGGFFVAVERTVHGKGRRQSTAEGGDSEQRQVEQRVVDSMLQRNERNEEHSGEGETNIYPGFAPGHLAGADQAVNQTDESGGQHYGPSPVRPTGVRRLGLVHLPPGDDKRGHTDRQVDQEDAPPADAGGDDPSENRSEPGGHPSDRTPDSEGHPPLLAVEALSQKSQRGGEQDRPADALGTAGQDQHDRRLGYPAEQRPEGEDDETDAEQQSVPVTVGERTGGQKHRRQGQGIGVDDPLQVAETRVQTGLDGRQGDDHDRDVQQQHECGGAHHHQGPPFLFHDL
jgi:hypothetical protein